MPRCLTFGLRPTEHEPDEKGEYGPFCCGNRIAQIQLRRGPFRLSANLAGTYDTTIVDSDGRDLGARELEAGMSPSIQWTQATFVGHHRLLGPLRVDLAPGRPSLGDFDQPAAQKGFFPARNRNELYFRIAAPRFGRVYENETALVNEAAIDAVPPIGSVYELAEPVRFSNPKQGSDWWDITKCYVMMPDQKWIGIEVTSIEKSPDGYRIVAMLENKSPSRRTIAYWFTNSDEPDRFTFKPRWGMVLLDRTKKQIEFEAVCSSPDVEPIIELGAAVITNPVVNDPSKAGGVGTYAAHLKKRMAFLAQETETP